MIEEGWAMFFGKYDVFAGQDTGTQFPREGLVTGTGGLASDRTTIAQQSATPAVETRGLGRAFLQLLKHYWVNSGIAVGLMLLLGLGNGYTVLWKIFGATNQLLAALSLLVGSYWLLSRSRPVWYTLLPSVFMLVTSVWMLIRVIRANLAGWPDKAALVITGVILLAMTVGIVTQAVIRGYAYAARPGLLSHPDH
jgi:hypothetical protein